ncbi:MAG: TIGR02646 family protein [Candidatus Coatesbacteria bacterium]|nr:TIGR02646 family protein [Candidatus Coatesbacteria bacterium]
MKLIVKRDEPEGLRNHREQKNEDWQPDFDDLPSAPKIEIHGSLLREQGYICCYCNMQISASSSHVEHFRPRSRFPEKSLEYGNLHASCQRQIPRKTPLKCGMKKGDWFDERLIISPLQADCETRFRFTVDGAIYPSNENDAAARETIVRLGLDQYELRRRRSESIEAIISAIESYDANDIERLIYEFERRDGMERFTPFCVALIYILKSHL